MMRALLFCAALLWASEAFGAIEYEISGGGHRVMFDGTFSTSDDAWNDGVVLADEFLAWTINVFPDFGVPGIPDFIFTESNSTIASESFWNPPRHDITWLAADDRSFRTDALEPFRSSANGVFYATGPEVWQSTDQDGLEPARIEQVAIPEPASLAVWGVLGIVGAIVWRRRR